VREGRITSRIMCSCSKHWLSNSS